ncbi:MAG TPA: mechanosensitive ion channel domain-containing protein, partial [bacterium]
HQAGATLAIVVGFYVLHQLFKWTISQLVSRPEVRQGYWGLSRNVLVFVATALIIAVWLEELKAVSLLLTGLLAATLLVNKELFLGLASRVALSVVQQYDIGDRIRINNLCGDVIDIGLLSTWLMEVDFDGVENQSTGRIVVFPHIWLSQHAVINLTRGHDFMWDEIQFSFPPDIDGTAAAALLAMEAERQVHEEIEHARRAVWKMAESYASRNPPVTPIAYARLVQQPSGHQILVMTLRFSVQVRRRREVHSRLVLHLLQKLREKEIPIYMNLHDTLPRVPGRSVVP